MRAGLALLVIASILALSFATQANAAPVAQGVTLDTKSSTWPVARRLMQLLGFIKEAAPAVPAPAAAPKAAEQAKPAAAAAPKPVVQAKPAAAPQPAAQAKPAVQAKAEQVVQKPVAKEEPKQPAKPVDQPKQPAAVPPQQQQKPVEAPKVVEQPPKQQQKPVEAPKVVEQPPKKAVEQPQAPKQTHQVPKQQKPESVPGPWEQAPPTGQKQGPLPSIKNNSPFSGSKGHHDDDLGSLIDDVLAPGKSHEHYKPEYKPEYKDDDKPYYYGEEEKHSYYKKPSYDSEHLREIYNKGGSNKKAGDDYWYGDDGHSNKQYHNNDKKGDEYYGRKPEPRYYEPHGDSHYEAPRDSKYYEKPHYEAPSHYEPREKYYEAPHHSNEPIKRPTYDAPKPRYSYKPEHPAPRGRPGYDHRGDEEDASYGAPIKPDHDYSEYSISDKHNSYQDLKHGYESLQKDYEEISSRYDLDDKYSSYKDNKSAYEQLRDKLESKAAVDELKGLYNGLKKMFDELKNTISDQDKKEQWKHEVEEKLRKEAEEKKEYEEYVAKRKAQEAERKAAEEQEKKEYEEFVAKKEAQRKAEEAERKAEDEKRKKEHEEADKKEKKEHDDYEKERKESNDYFSSEPGKKDTWSEDWETDKPGYKHNDSYKGPDGDKYFGGDEYSSDYDSYGKKKHRKPRYFENYPDPADPGQIADPKCHMDFSPFYNQHEYKFACFAEKPGHREIEGDTKTPDHIRAGLQCCNPEDNLNYPHGYPGAHHGYPDDIPIVKMLELAGDCNFTITYFNHGDLSHDGLCVGTVDAHCLINKPCHAADHPLEYTLHGVVKAKPAKIHVETTAEEVPDSGSYNYTYGGSYGYGEKEEYLPGTALIAYLTDEPSEAPTGTKGDYYGGAAHGKVLLKYVINWYNDVAVIPNETGEIGTISPGAPVELSNHAHLPLVEVGTVGLFLKQEHHYDGGYYGAGGKPPGYGGPGPYGKPPGPKYIH